MEFCRYDSGYHLRKNEMLKNLDKIEKDATTMEKKDVCFCCGESYDTFHVRIGLIYVMMIKQNYYIYMFSIIILDRCIFVLLNFTVYICH